MKKYKVFFAFAVFLIAVVLRLWNLNEMGRTWEEGALVEKGYSLVELIKKGDFNNRYWIDSYDHPPLVNYFYGVASYFDFIRFSPSAVPEYLGIKGAPVFTYDLNNTRLVSVFISSLAVVLVFLFGWKYISPFVGLTAALVLSAIPSFVGLSQRVTYESFTMFFFTGSVYSFVYFLEKQSFKSLILAGVMLGLSVEVKQPNVLLVPLFLVIYYLWNRYSQKKINKKNIGLKIIFIFAVAFIIYFVLWPMPWFHLKEFLSSTYNLWLSGKVGPIPEVFFGKLMGSPIVYFYFLFLITTPFLLLLLFLTGLKSMQKEKLIFYILIAWFIIPFFLSFQNTRQGGVRYIIQAYAPFSLLVGIGFNYLLEKFRLNIKVKLFFLFILFLYLVIVLARITPYYYDYFNAVVGGAKNVYEKKLFLMGGSGEGLRETSLYLEKFAPKGSKIGFNFNPPHTFKPVNGLAFYVFKSDKYYDYVVVNYYSIIRNGFDSRILQKDYNLVYAVKADGASLAFVYKHK